MSLRGCVLTFVLIGVAMYAFTAGLGVFWWGRGFVGAMEGRHAPERIRAANTLYIYDTVVIVKRDRVEFRQSLWKPLRRAILAFLGTALALFIGFAVKRKSGARRWLWIGLVAAAIAFFTAYDSSIVSVPRNGARVVVRRYGLPRGGPSTRSSYEDESGYDLELAGGTRLVRLPWNEQRDADIWQKLIEEKLRP